MIFILYSVSLGAVTSITIPTNPTNNCCGIKVNIPIKKELILALSGGAVRGIAHAGALAALEEAGIRPTGIAGVSIGALVAGLYAGGLSPNEIKLAIQDINLETIMLDQPGRNSLLLARKKEYSRHLIELRLSKKLSPILPGAISPGQKLYQRLLELTLNLPFNNADNWDNLSTRLRILATDINTGEPVVFSSGDLAPAIRASMSVPLLFDPFEYDSHLLIDGGVSANIPVNIAATMSNDVIVAIDLTSDLDNHDLRYKPWQVVNQVTTIMQQQPNMEARKKASLTITPEFDDSLMSGGEFNYYFEAGRQAMHDRIPEIKKLLKSPTNNDDTLALKFVSLKTIPKSHPVEIMELISASDIKTIADVKLLIAKLYYTGLVAEAKAEYDVSVNSLLLKIDYNPVINEIHINGNNHLSNSDLLPLFDSYLGKILNMKNFHISIIKLLKLYREVGLSASYIKSVEIDDVSGIITITVNEGLLESIVFKGLDKVPEAFLSAEVPIKPGNPVTYASVIKGTDNLYATGLFRNVSPVLYRYGDKIKLVFHIQEHPSPPVRLGLAYHSDRRTHGFLETVLPSPFTYASSLSLYLSVGEKDDLHRVFFSIDKFFGFPLMSNISLAYSSHDRKRYNTAHEETGDYTESKWGTNFKIGGTPTRWGLLAFTARWEEHNNINISSESQYNLQGIGVELALDTQDRYPYPNKGLSFNANFESAATNIDVNTKFNRFWSSFEGHMPLTERYTLGLKTRGNFADRTTPIDEQFKLGGIYDFTGLQLDEKIGLVQLTAGWDLRFDLLSRLLSDAYLGLHGDIGGSWNDPEAQFDREDWLISFGTYFVFDTILGPLHLEWGQLIPNGSHPRQNVVYFQAGNLF